MTHLVRQERIKYWIEELKRGKDLEEPASVVVDQEEKWAAEVERITAQRDNLAKTIIDLRRGRLADIPRS